MSGSHHLGRIDHVMFGEQVGADAERVAHAQKLCPVVHVEVCLTLDKSKNAFF